MEMAEQGKVFKERDIFQLNGHITQAKGTVAGRQKQSNGQFWGVVASSATTLAERPTCRPRTTRAERATC